MKPQRIKTDQLQIRISPEQKREIGKRAKAEGYTISEWILKLALGKESSEFNHLLSELENKKEIGHSLAALHDFLVQLSSEDLEKSLPAPSVRLSPLLLNLIAAMIEELAIQKGLNAPSWIFQIEPLKEPYFATQLNSLKLHLMITSPVPFRKRNLFVDSSIGDRA